MRLFAVLATLLLLAGAVRAQPAPTPQTPVYTAYTQRARAPDIPVTSSSSDTVLGNVAPTTSSVAIVRNVGTNDAFVLPLASAGSVTAASGIPVPAGSCVSLNVSGQNHLAAITASSTTTLEVSLGSGSPMWCPAGGGGGGGGGGTSSNFAASFPTAGTAIGLSDGVNMQPLRGDTTNGAWVNVKSSVLPTGASTAALQSSIITALGSPMQNSGGTVGISGTLPAFAATPTVNLGTIGTAATAANQTTGNASLASIDSKTPALGQALAAGSIPVVLTAAQLTTLTPPTTVAVTQSTSPWVVSLASTTITGTVAATQSGTWNINNVSGTVSLPTGASTSALQPTNAAIASTTAGQTGHLEMGAVTTGAPTYITAQTNPLSLTTAGALRVDGSGVTQPVSLTSTTITGTVAVTQSGSWSLAANQSMNVAQINGVTPLMGNGVTGTGSQRVTIASDNTAFSVNAIESGTWNITNVSGTVSLPTGASTSALQPTNAAIASTTSGQTGYLMMGAVTTSVPTYVSAQTNPLSLTTGGLLRVDASGATVPVTLTSTTITGTVAVTQSGSWSLSANQSVNVAQVAGATTAVGSGVMTSGTQRMALASDSPGIVTLGQSTMANSVPVTMASDQSAIASNITTVAGTAISLGQKVDASSFPVVLPADQVVSTGTQTSPSSAPFSNIALPSSASSAGLAPVSSSALAANSVIKASGGNLYSFEVAADSTLSAAAWWIMIYNATSAPADGAVTPTKCYGMPSGAISYAAAFPVPVQFSTGITVGVSTTGCFTKTASTHAFISGDAQ